jgi:hypothetical protein
MEALFANGLMELLIQESGNHVKKMVKVLFNSLMVQFTKVSSKMTNLTDRVPRCSQMVVLTQVNSSSVCSMAMVNSNKQATNPSMKDIGDKIK